jgi:hypothetical protein
LGFKKRTAKHIFSKSWSFLRVLKSIRNQQESMTSRHLPKRGSHLFRNFFITDMHPVYSVIVHCVGSLITVLSCCSCACSSICTRFILVTGWRFIHGVKSTWFELKTTDAIQQGCYKIYSSF